MGSFGRQEKLPLKWFVLWALCLAGVSIAADLGGMQIVADLFEGYKYYDVVIHFFLVGSLGLCAALASSSTDPKLFLWLPRLVWMVLLAAVLEECTQLFRENRGFSFADMAANVFGILVFGTVGLLVKKRLFGAKAVSAN